MVQMPNLSRSISLELVTRPSQTALGYSPNLPARVEVTVGVGPAVV